MRKKAAGQGKSPLKIEIDNIFFGDLTWQFDIASLEEMQKSKKQRKRDAEPSREILSGKSPKTLFVGFGSIKNFDYAVPIDQIADEEAYSALQDDLLHGRDVDKKFFKKRGGDDCFVKSYEVDGDKYVLKAENLKRFVTKIKALPFPIVKQLENFMRQESDELVATPFDFHEKFTLEKDASISEEEMRKLFEEEFSGIFEDYGKPAKKIKDEPSL